MGSREAGDLVHLSASRPLRRKQCSSEWSSWVRARGCFRRGIKCNCQTDLTMASWDQMRCLCAVSPRALETEQWTAVLRVSLFLTCKTVQFYWRHYAFNSVAHIFPSRLIHLLIWCWHLGQLHQYFPLWCPLLCVHLQKPSPSWNVGSRLHFLFCFNCLHWPV